MVLNIGSDVMVRLSCIVGIFDSNALLSSRRNRNYLNSMKESGKISGWDKNTVSFVLTYDSGKEHIFCSSISLSTLAKRMDSSFVGRTHSKDGCAL